MRGMATVRPAQLADAAAAGRVGVAAWQAAYRGLMPDAYLDALDERPRAERFQAALAAGGGDGRVLVGRDWGTALVAEDSSRDIVGFVTFGDLRDGSEDVSPTGEIWALNILPAAWRRGVARALLRRALMDLTQAGHAAAALWVRAGRWGWF